ncbi:MAG: hypothetical protein ACXVY9_02740 [Terriglobales bacterium]
MARKSSALISCALLLGLGLAAEQPAHAANKKKELAKQAAEAEQNGDLDQAGALYCELLQVDKKNKTAKAKCDEYTQRNQALDAKDTQAMAAGKSALGEHRFQDAIAAFKSVTSKRYKDEASRYLSKDIPEAQKAFAAEQAQRQQREEEAHNADRLKQGTEAYQKNDFDGAKAVLLRVTGPNAAEAKRLLQNIDQYTAGFNEGFKLEKAGKTKQASERYRQILKIKADGPWEVGKKLAHLQQEAKAAAAAAAQPAASQAGLTAEESALADAISGYYRGEYQQAGSKLASYAGDGPKKALALFYLGACELSQYFLATPANSPKELYERAVEHFRAAHKAAPSFAPPVQYISPRVLKIYNEAGS